MWIGYDDFDGISLIVDVARLAERYRDHHLPSMPEDAQFSASVAAHVHRTLCGLIADGVVAAWGTHQCGGVAAELTLGEASPTMLEAAAAKSRIEAGTIETTGEIALLGWGAFTYVADCARGQLSEALGPVPTVEIPPGRYRVVVHRPFDAEDGAFDGTATFVVELLKTDAAFSTPETTPGADGWF